MTWIERTDDLARYLHERTRRAGASFRREHDNPRTGLYVLWVENDSPFRVRDFQRRPKTEILPKACSVKAGRFTRGFFERRDLDDTQLHVRGDASQVHASWRRNRAGHWLVFRETFRGIYATSGGVAQEQQLLNAVRSWLSCQNLLVLPTDHQRIINTNNTNPGFEQIGPGDFPRGEWMHVHCFCHEKFRDLMRHVVAVGVV